MSFPDATSCPVPCRAHARRRGVRCRARPVSVVGTRASDKGRQGWKNARPSYLHQPVRELAEMGVVVRFDDVVVVVKFAEIERLLDHLGVLGEAGLVFLAGDALSGRLEGVEKRTLSCTR